MVRSFICPLVCRGLVVAVRAQRPRVGVKGGAPAGVSPRTYDLAAGGAGDAIATAKSLCSRSWLPPWGVGTGGEMAGSCVRASSLIWVLEPGRGRVRRRDDGWGDRARPPSLSRLSTNRSWQQEGDGSWPQHICGVNQARTTCTGQAAWGNGRPSTAASAWSPRLIRQIEVGSAGTGGALGGLEQRPAQHLWSLLGQMPAGPFAVRRVDGDVQAGVAHNGVAVAEAAGVAEFGQDRRRGQLPDAVVISDQRLVAWLTVGVGAQSPLDRI